MVPYSLGKIRGQPTACVGYWDCKDSLCIWHLEKVRFTNISLCVKDICKVSRAPALVLIMASEHTWNLQNMLLLGWKVFSRVTVC